MRDETSLLHYGLQRSGTNFLEALLRRRYKARLVNDNANRGSPIHKHFRLYDRKDLIPEEKYRNQLYPASFNDYEALLTEKPDYYIVVSKDPYSWYLSYRSWGRKCGWPEPGHHYIAEYNLFYRKWLDFAAETDRIVFVRYIDLLTNTEAELGRLERIMGLSKRWRAKLMFSGVPKVSQSPRFGKEEHAYYERKKYLSRYVTEELRALNEALDHEVMARLGYEKEENPEI